MQKKTLSLILSAAVFLVIPCSKNSVEAAGADKKKSERKYRETVDGEGALTQKMLEDPFEKIY